MSIERIRSLASFFVAGAMILGTGSGDALAQEAPAKETKAGAGGDLLDPERKGEVIILTGSAIERRDLTTPAPLAIVDKEALDASGMVSIGDVLQNLPSQSNAINVQFNNGGNGATRIALRGLDDERTLVMVNGRRHVPWGNSVDLNAIPMAIIERVEVLKDGASAIYGSDAIGGVVNVITRKHFDGTETALYTGTPAGGGATYDVSAAAGHSSERGNIMLSAGFYRQEPLMASARSYSSSDKIYNWKTQKATPGGSQRVPQGYIKESSKEGNELWVDLVTRNPTGIYFNDPVDGWRDFRFGGNQESGEGDLYNYQPENYLVTPQQRYNIFSAGNYSLNSSTRAFYETSYLNRTSDQMLAPEPFITLSENITVSKDNLFNPFGRNFRAVEKRMLEGGNRRFYQNVNTFRIVAGVDGHLPANFGRLEGFRWSASYNYGRADSMSVNEGRYIRSRMAQALGPSYVDATGKPRCGTPDNPGDPACVPLDLFSGQGSVTQEMLDYVTYTGTSNQPNKLTSILLTSAGKIAETPWGGDVAVALGAEYRQLEGGNEPDPLTASGDTTGNKVQPTYGGYDVKEIFGELSVVPVVDQPFAQWLELSAAARGFAYSTFDSDYTWKLGGLWRVLGGMAFRGTYSTAFRAPTIFELYGGRSDSYPAVTDPCDTSQGSRSENEQINCTTDGLPSNYADQRTQINAPTGGNENLQPETATIFTFGSVYEPTGLPGLALTLDYFNIEVENAIALVGASVILSNCYDQPPEKRAHCDLITRDSTGFITSILNLRQNIGGAETAGIDFSARYQYKTGIGTLRHRIEGTWLQKYNETTAARKVYGRGVYDLGVYPTWKCNFTTQWGRGPWNAGFNMRYIGSFRECEDNDCSQEDALTRPVDFNITADLFGSYLFATAAGRTRLAVGVNNVLNQYPPVIYQGFQADSDASTYDYLGTYGYLRVVQQF